MIRRHRTPDIPALPTDTARRFASTGSLPVFALLLTGMLWSTSGFLIRLVPWNPLAIAGTRSFIALILILLLTGIPKITFSRAQVLAALFYAGTMLLFVTANKLTTSANAILLQYTSPVFVAVFASMFLGEKTRKSEWVLISAVLAGMVLFFMDKLSFSGFWGNIVAIGSGVFLALNIVFMRMQKQESTMGSMVLGHALTSLFAIPFLFGDLPSVTGWTGLALLGVFQMGIPSILFSYSVRRLSAVSTIIISLIEPVLNPVWVFFLAGEIPERNALIGGAIILGVVTARSVWITVRKKDGPAAELSPPPVT